MGARARAAHQSGPCDWQLGVLDCHFDEEGYAQIAKLMSPLVEHDNYGLDRTKNTGRAGRACG